MASFFKGVGLIDPNLFDYLFSYRPRPENSGSKTRGQVYFVDMIVPVLV
jgi:hypothetical protein